jgi:cell division protein FtsB
MKLLLIVLITLLVALQYKLWIDEDGVREVWRLTKEVEAHKSEIAILQERNNVLTAEVIDLKSGLDAIEERARTDLGMIRENETFYHLIGNESIDGSRIFRDETTGGTQ